MSTFWNAPDIECVLAYFGDGQFTIKIDRLRTGEIRYLCWHKSTSILARPNLILRNGEVKETVHGETLEYIFLHNNQVFTVEYVPAQLNSGTNYFFMEVTDTDQQKSTWKMEQMSIPKYFR